MMTIRDCREETRDILNSIGNDEAAVITDILISHYLGTDRGSMLAKLDDEAPTDLPYRLADAVNMISVGMPVQYIMGSCWFYGLEVKVGPGCFIPRADTEILAKAAIGLLRNGGSFIELCAGSGCVSMAIAENVEGVRGTAAELSLKALPFTEANLEKYPNVKVKRADVLDPDDLNMLFEEWGEGYDLLVCNPPYIPTADIATLDVQVQYEPETALDGGENGLKYYRYIIANADLIMKPSHRILFEVGVGQASAVAQMLSVMGYAVAVFKDLGGIDRVVLGEK
ncbi:MAG: peptide chain release factor N(5)-glutamine methyltransferase [Ruminococcaceae bacterium]|nr:peptide chain release factor N(5)-glutamine methyltransferase [Oscillospiraceae bacterium]